MVTLSDLLNHRRILAIQRVLVRHQCAGTIPTQAQFKSYLGELLAYYEAYPGHIGGACRYLAKAMDALDGTQRDLGTAIMHMCCAIDNGLFREPIPALTETRKHFESYRATSTT